MTLDIQQQAQRRMRRLVVLLVGLVVVLLAVIVLGFVLSSGSDDNGKGAAPTPSPSPSASEPEPTETADDGDSGGYVEPSEWVALPPGAKESAGLPVKFPHTPEGAASMVAASVRNSWSFDPDQVEKGVRTYMVKRYQDQGAAGAEASTAELRKTAGVPAKGTLPQGASINAWPIGLQVDEMNANEVEVFILTRVTYTSGEGQKPTTKLVVNPARAVWEDGDWKTLPANPSRNLPDPADIGEPEFNAADWKAIQEGDRR